MSSQPDEALAHALRTASLLTILIHWLEAIAACPEARRVGDALALAEAARSCATACGAALDQPCK